MKGHFISFCYSVVWMRDTQNLPLGEPRKAVTVTWLVACHPGSATDFLLLQAIQFCLQNQGIKKCPGDFFNWPLKELHPCVMYSRFHRFAHSEHRLSH